MFLVNSMPWGIASPLPFDKSYGLKQPTNPAALSDSEKRWPPGLPWGREVCLFVHCCLWCLEASLAPGKHIITTHGQAPPRAHRWASGQLPEDPDTASVLRPALATESLLKSVLRRGCRQERMEKPPALSSQGFAGATEEGRVRGGTSSAGPPGDGVCHTGGREGSPSGLQRTEVSGLSATQAGRHRRGAACGQRPGRLQEALKGAEVPMEAGHWARPRGEHWDSCC